MLRHAVARTLSFCLSRAFSALKISVLGTSVRPSAAVRSSSAAPFVPVEVLVAVEPVETHFNLSAQLAMSLTLFGLTSVFVLYTTFRICCVATCGPVGPALLRRLADAASGTDAGKSLWEQLSAPSAAVAETVCSRCGAVKARCLPLVTALRIVTSAPDETWKG